METWLAIVLIVTLMTLMVGYAWRKDRRRERAEFEAPDDIFDAPAARTGTGARGSRSPEHDRHESDASDGDAGGGDGGGGSGGD